LAHTFATPFEYLIEKRNIPVVPFFTNVYLPPLPTAKRCAALGRAVAEVIKGRKERVAVIASGGMSHYPGTSKYPNPEYVGMIGGVPGELIQYTPTWHHGHGYMRFLPVRERTKPMMPKKELYGGFKFKDQGFEFYKHPPANVAKISKLLYDARLSPTLVQRIMKDLDQVAKDYGLTTDERKLAQGLIDVGAYQGKVSDFVPRFVDFGVHPLLALMAIHATYPAAKKFAQEKVGAGQKN
jgi:2,3-dihydroxyphenylpropionate 1,2-dioxygenase